MVVTFRKLAEQRLVTWTAVRGKRTKVPGATMALGRPDQLPHDVVQLIAEAVAGVDRGFWGSIAAGATFRSCRVKRTRPGRAVIAANRSEIKAAEHIAGDHVERWIRGDETPAAAHLDELTSVWAVMGDGEELTIEWPTLRRLPSRQALR